jgi:hypothetical protein
MADKKYYAGIGSRKTPEDVLDNMFDIASKLETKGYTLRSGGADGADDAFAQGTEVSDIYLPWRGFNDVSGSKLNEAEAWTYKIAEELHPAWSRCSQGAKKLHARNIHQILGDAEDASLCEFVVCWTPNGRMKGGTATAIKLAKSNGIKVYNLAKSKDVLELRDKLNEG